MNLRDRSSAGLLCLLSLGLLNGCRQDMQNQPKFYPQRGSAFFRDRRSVRQQVAGTVARSQGNSEDYFHTGMNGKIEGDGIPLPVTIGLLERGQERFNIFCSPCHSRVGNGKGMIVERGYYPATSLHSERLRQAPLGHFFSVITNGYGVMPDYSSELTPVDRWAVTAYIRALQLSQHASAATDLLPGVNPENLSDISVKNGFSKEFLSDWMPGQLATPVQFPRAAVPVPTQTAWKGETVLPTSAGRVHAAKSAIPGKAAGVASEPAGAVVGKARAIGETPVPKAPASKSDVTKGEALYSANCSMCHQKTREGLPPIIPSLIGVVGRVGEERVRFVTTNGIPEAKPPMPPPPNLSEQDLDDLVAFLKTK